MFVSMIFIRALLFCLVPFTKLDEGFTELSTVGMQIRSEFNLNSPNSLRIRSQHEFAANSA